LTIESIANAIVKRLIDKVKMFKLIAFNA